MVMIYWWNLFKYYLIIWNIKEYFIFSGYGYVIDN